MKYRSLLFIPLVMLACKSKPKAAPDPDNGSFPVVGFIQSQVAGVDTSLYKIIKVVTVGGKSDSSFIRREDFRKEAAAFLDLEDISTPGKKDEYTESRTYVQELESAALVYTAKDPSAEIRWEQVLIEPGNGGEDKVKTLIIEKQEEKGNKSVKKNLLWQVDRFFSIHTVTANNDGSETVEQVKVIWNASNENE